jgi:hypothetical protein
MTTIKRRLPATSHTVSGRSISAGGQEYLTEIIFVNDAGRAYRAHLVGTPPAWQFTATPVCDDVPRDFNTCDALATNVPTCDALVTWGFT